MPETHSDELQDLLHRINLLSDSLNTLARLVDGELEANPLTQLSDIGHGLSRLIELQGEEAGSIANTLDLHLVANAGARRRAKKPHRRAASDPDTLSAVAIDTSESVA